MKAKYIGNNTKCSCGKSDYICKNHVYDFEKDYSVPAGNFFMVEMNCGHSTSFYIDRLDFNWWNVVRIS